MLVQRMDRLTHFANLQHILWHIKSMSCTHTYRSPLTEECVPYDASEESMLAIQLVRAIWEQE